MKKLLIITALLFSFQFGKSQAYIPFVEDSMIVVNKGINNLYIYKYIGDTSINGNVYKRVYLNSNKNDSTFVINSYLTYFGAIRENSRRVYFVFKDSINEKKIYDFNLLNYGDSTYLFYRKVNKYLKAKVWFTDSVSCDSNILITNYETDSLFGAINYESYMIRGYGLRDYYYDIEDKLTYRMCVCKQSKRHIDCHDISYKKCLTLTSINETNLAKNIKLYPNPSKENITIENTGNKQINSLKIFTISGKLIKEVNFINQKNKETVSVKELPKGIYFVQVLVGDDLVTLKFIKE